MGNNNKMTEKICEKDLGENCNYLGWFLFLAGFRI